MEPISFLRIDEVKRRTGLSRSSIYLRAKAGTFPGFINLGGRATGWISHEMDSWITARIEASRRGTQREDEADSAINPGRLNTVGSEEWGAVRKVSSGAELATTSKRAQFLG